MMPALQYLRHGKALCGKVFKRFVETFNYHNDFIANLKGDGDLPMSDGCINLDLVDPKHPVIRLNKQKLALPDPKQGGAQSPGRFDITIEEGEEDEDSEPSHTATFSNCYYDVGGKTYETSVEELELSGGEIVALKVTATGSSPSAEIVTYGSLADLQSAQGNKDYYVRPLYKIGSEFAIECDFRTGPTFDMGEFWT